MLCGPSGRPVPTGFEISTHRQIKIWSRKSRLQRIISQNKKLQKPQNNKSIDNPLKGLGYSLTEKALKGQLDVVIGRDKEIDGIIQTLARKTKNSPLLIGEAGVGKSAIVEGLAIKIAKGNVPDTLKNKNIFSFLAEILQ